VTEGGIRLGCTLEEFENLGPAEETWFIPGTGDFAGYGPGQVGYWPYYGLAGGGLGVTGTAAMSPLALDGIPPRTVVRDTIPLGEIEIRRGDPVHSTDGDIGKVQGLVIDTGSRHITHVLLQEGTCGAARRSRSPSARWPAPAKASSSRSASRRYRTQRQNSGAYARERRIIGPVLPRGRRGPGRTSRPRRLRPANVTHCTTLQQDCP
jgi:hypothetical protein